MTSKPKLCILAGPTASGKSSAGLAVAQMGGMEIVSADSMQIYRGMDIGTAKATAREQSAVPHHMLDVCDPTESYTAALYGKEAAAAIEGIHARGNIPLLVGGTGLYISAVIDGLNFAQSEGGGEERERWELFLALRGPEELHKELAKVDPPSAQRLHPNDTRRIIRALEVFDQTGQPASMRARFTDSPYDLRFAALRMDRALLNERINKRVDQMMADGLLTEARHIWQKGSNTARQAIGYRQLFTYFEGGCSLEEAVQQIRMESRRYAKRQMTWFSRDPRIRWFDALENNLPRAIHAFYTDQRP